MYIHSQQKKMKYTILSLLLALGIFTFGSAQVMQDSKTYPVVIKFQSVCCGVPDEAPLVKFLKTFKKQQKFKMISADRIGPMGKEGEYYLAFTLKGFTKKQKTVFKQKLKTVVSKMNDKGNAVLEENMTIIKADLPSRAITEKVYF